MRLQRVFAFLQILFHPCGYQSVAYTTFLFYLSYGLMLI